MCVIHHQRQKRTAWKKVRALAFITYTSEDVCGVPVITSRIVGGTDASEGEWPWQASLRLKGNGICGGSIITNDWVLSAAHCYYKRGHAMSEYSVCMGMHQLSGTNWHSMCSDLSQVILHPYYSIAGGPGDIMLLKLEPSIGFTKRILPVCLPETFFKFPTGMNCWSTGWGRIYSSATASVSLPSPKTLQKVKLPIIDQQTCDGLYHVDSVTKPSKMIILNDMICAGFKEGGKDACQGDSGGPLVCSIDDVWYLAGVVSWGVYCGQPNRPGVYTLVTAYNKWILKHVPEVQFGLHNITLDACKTRTTFISLLFPAVVISWSAL
ncbi:serine protease 27-like isoform X2 [Ambystoma mexicanum]|uniref:serine protease 27-like isoform X2 n=1 Tax=Ambystoma mexicanum TaxID=8296 RepID=UPI0037E98422